MQLNAALFSNPTLRAGLEAYYTHKKNALIDTLSNPSFQSEINLTITKPDGTSQTAKGRFLTAGMAEKSFVSFDKWLEIQEQTYTNSSKALEIAKDNLDLLQQQNPDSISQIRVTFSNDNDLLASINADGSVSTANIGPDETNSAVHTAMENKIHDIVAEADSQQLIGQSRIDYLASKIKEVFSQEYPNLTVNAYTKTSSPTLGEFSKMWHKNFDIDQHYQDALTQAENHYNDLQTWHNQWQNNVQEMNAFLLSFQESS